MEEPVGPFENPTDEFDDWVNGMSAGHLDAMPDLQDGSELDPSLKSWLPLDDSSFQYEWDENLCEYEPSFDGSFGQEFQSDGFSEMLSPDASSEVVTGLASGLASASQSSSSAFDASSYNRDIVADSAWTSLSSQTLKQFWENDFWDNMMSPVVDPVDLLSSGLKRPAPVVMHNYDGGELEVSEEVVKKVAKQTSMDFTSCVKDILPHNWKEERESLHQTAIFRWHALLLSWHDEVDIDCALQCKGDKRMQLQIIVDIFYKAPSTLMKRVRSLSRVTIFCLDRGLSFPCTEEQMYGFLCAERDSGAAPSRMNAVLEACVFARDVLGVVQLEPIIKSRRCSGTAIYYSGATQETSRRAIQRCGRLEQGLRRHDTILCVCQESVDGPSTLWQVLHRFLAPW